MGSIKAISTRKPFIVRCPYLLCYCFGIPWFFVVTLCKHFFLNALSLGTVVNTHAQKALHLAYVVGIAVGSVVSFSFFCFSNFSLQACSSTWHTPEYGITPWKNFVFNGVWILLHIFGYLKVLFLFVFFFFNLALQTQVDKTPPRKASPVSRYILLAFFTPMLLLYPYMFITGNFRQVFGMFGMTLPDEFFIENWVRAMHTVYAMCNVTLVVAMYCSLYLFFPLFYSFYQQIPV